MPGELILWDAVDHLRSTDDVCLYLEAAVEEDPGDGSLIHAALVNIARAERIGNPAGVLGSAGGELQDALSEPGGLTLATFMRVAGALGMRMRLAAPPDLEERLTLAEAAIPQSGRRSVAPIAGAGN